MDDRLNKVLAREKDYWVKAYRDRHYYPLEDWSERADKQVSRMFGGRERLSFWLKLGVSGHPLRLLDAGCGTGTFLMSWSRFFPGPCEIYGVDIRDEALTIARMKADLKGNHPIHLIKSSVEELPFPNGFFDIVHSEDLLEHLPEPRKAITELLRVTKKKGYFFTHVPDYRTGFEPHLKMRFNPPTPEGLEILKKKVIKESHSSEMVKDLYFIHPGEVEEIIRAESSSVAITRIYRKTRPFWKKYFYRLKAYKYDLLVLKTGF